MSVPINKNKEVYVGGGGATVYAYGFPIIDNSDLVVSVYDTATQAITVLTLDVDYTVSGAGEVAGGNVTVTEDPGAGKELIIERIMDITQEIEFDSNNPNQAEVFEEGLDRLTMICQQLDEGLSRAIKIDVSYEDTIDVTLPAPEAEKVIGWNADADGLENYDNPATAMAAAEAAADAAEAAQTAAEVASGSAIAAQAAAEVAQAAAEAARDAVLDIIPIPVTEDIGKVLVVGADLEYALLTLSNVLPAIGEGDQGKVITVKEDETGYELTSPASSIPTPSGAGDAGKLIEVNEAGDGYELIDLSAQLPPEPGEGDAGKVLAVKEDESGYELIDIEDITSGFMNVQVFTSSGTFNKPAGVSKVFVEAQGQGGYGSRTGGGAGAYCNKICTLTENVTVTIAPAQVRGASPVATTFGDFLSAGAGGGGADSVADPVGGVGGVATDGDVNCEGDDGDFYHGGASKMGGGGRYGYAGNNYGGGGGGGPTIASKNGAQGIIIVRW